MFALRMYPRHHFVLISITSQLQLYHPSAIIALIATKLLRYMKIRDEDFFQLYKEDGRNIVRHWLPYHHISQKVTEIFSQESWLFIDKPYYPHVPSLASWHRILPNRYPFTTVLQRPTFETPIFGCSVFRVPNSFGFGIERISTSNDCHRGNVRAKYINNILIEVWMALA
ncbi:hypothetical protein RCL_jg4968.t1 [Rhizophagus clarus]|uniref:Uncharacterized protein n=1 Tax=Rhizophagus clarus TaxID=94130 RepID=A0A8H3QKD7_9GLOM|nr:hypothetical protein RCL_jg4968.t1 [Rhizophagus clarus]